MTGSRCPACGAATPEGVPWCSLCFTDLRPAPAADVPATTSQPIAAAPASHPGPVVDARPDPLTAPISTLLESPPPLDPVVARVPEPVLPAVVPADADLDPADTTATWPCARCGASVDLASDACPECGAGFLAGAIPPPTMSVPLLGNVTRFSATQRFGLAAGLAVTLILLFVAILTVSGAIL